jgi:hypothetical protein
MKRFGVFGLKRLIHDDAPLKCEKRWVSRSTRGIPDHFIRLSQPLHKLRAHVRWFLQSNKVRPPFLTVEESAMDGILSHLAIENELDINPFPFLV